MMNYDLGVLGRVAIACVIAFPTLALANGRPAGTSTINARPGSPDVIAAGMTFGLVLSSDGGATWRWVCEDAVGYGGDFDPDYAYTASGRLFATTQNETTVTVDGCTFAGTSLAASAVTVGPDGALYLAAAAPATAANPNGDRRIHKSIDEGMTFLPDPADPGTLGDTWTTIEVAPTNASRVYLAGYSVSANGRELRLLRSDDGGASFSPMPTTGITATRDSSPYIVGVSPTDPDTLYLRVTYQQTTMTSDGLYRSTDGGQQWQRIFERPDTLTLLERTSGELIAAGRYAGAFSSSDGVTWTPLAGAPHITCLVERAGNEVWACTQNVDDGAGIMKSTDLASWTPVLRFEDVAAPVPCAEGTPQRDQCVDDDNQCGGQWCCLRTQLGIAADPTACPALPAGDVTPPPKDGCCSGSAGSGSALLTLMLAAGLGRRRRRDQRFTTRMR